MKIQNVFRTALIATLAVGVGILIWNAAATLAGILTYIGAALFIAMGLDPLVRWITSKGLPRWAALVITFIGVIGIVTALIFMVVPSIVQQSSGFFNDMVDYIK